MKIDDTLSAEFGIQPMGKTEVITKTGEVINDSTNKIQDDFDVTRGNLRILLQQGQEALQKSLDVALKWAMGTMQLPEQFFRCLLS